MLGQTRRESPLGPDTMKRLQKLPGSRRAPPGLEWYILRRLPALTLLGTVIPIACYLYALWFPNPAGTDSLEKQLSGVAIAAIATVLTVWTAAFTVAIGCAVVWIMKGPAYVADRYPLIDADEPQHPSPAAPHTGRPPP